MIQNLDGLIEQYRSELFDSVLPFWLENSIDKEYGGYFTCLDREGKVFDTDKFIWLQGREVWMFAMLYNKVAPRKEWLDAAVKGAEFLKKHGHDGNYNFYFSTTREGRASGRALQYLLQHLRHNGFRPAGKGHRQQGIRGNSTQSME